jgi:hypothetical protein
MNQTRKTMAGIALALCMLFSVMTANMAFADGEMPITVVVDGSQIQFDVEPVIEEGRTLVPMRFIFEALGAEVTWQEETRTATATSGERTIVITVDDSNMLKDGETVVLDVPARLIDGRTLVPVRAVSEGMGARVVWNEGTRRIDITSALVVPEPTQVPAGTPTPPPTATAKPSAPPKVLPYTELSDVDMEKLKSSYDNLIRYGFEQSTFPGAVLTDNAEIVREIQKKSDAAKQFAKDVWNKTVITRIIQIQNESETEYQMDSAAQMEENYLKLVQKAGLEADEYFDVSFESLDDGSTMMLLSFYKTDTLIACKYIGVVVRPSGTVRYFTAETDSLDKENLYFCEVTAKGRGTIGMIQFEKENFVAGVNVVLKKGLGV